MEIRVCKILSRSKALDNLLLLVVVSVTILEQNETIKLSTGGGYKPLQVQTYLF